MVEWWLELAQKKIREGFTIVDQPRVGKYSGRLTLTNSKGKIYVMPNRDARQSQKPIV